MTDIFTEQDLDQAKGYDVLGPAYFAARRIAEQIMAGVEVEPLKVVATKCADQMRDAVYEYVEDSMRSDLETNLQGHIRKMVERTVFALLTGEEWAMRQYPLSQSYDGAAIRAAVAKHGGEPLLMQRIAELEADVTRLQEDLRWYRSR